MIIDTSALIAILRDEPEAPLFARAIQSAATRRLSAANYLEAAIVIDGSRDPIASRRFDKGSGHPAGLNFGDCFAYALARATGEPLLFKGDDFTHTDVRPAVE
jgi:ribonuclease VapC